MRLGQEVEREVMIWEGHRERERERESRSGGRGKE